MIDIHNHIVYGIDDGAKNIEASIAMLNIAVEDGITGIIYTPHYIHGVNRYDDEIYDTHFKKLYDYIQAQNIPIQLYKGNELFIDELSIKDLINNKCKTIHNSRYILIEWQYKMPFNILKQMIYQLLVHQYVPIIAHAERMVSDKHDYQVVDYLLDQGCLLQINGSSVLKPKTRHKKGFIKKYLKERKIHFIASDAHNDTSRKPMLSEVRKYVEKKYGVDYAADIFLNNQIKVLENKVVHS